MKKLLILVIAFLLFSSTAHAVPTLWSGNNNHYDFISTNIGTEGYIVRPNGTAAVPEPATIALLCIGLVGLAGGVVRRRLKRVKQ